jgi:hypothetical protein
MDGDSEAPCSDFDYDCEVDIARLDEDELEIVSGDPRRGFSAPLEEFLQQS